MAAATLCSAAGLVNAAGTQSRAACGFGRHRPSRVRPQAQRFRIQLRADDCELPADRRSFESLVPARGQSVHLRSQSRRPILTLPWMTSRSTTRNLTKLKRPALAHRVPAFEAVRLDSAWAGHYDYNVFDQNAFLGPCESVPNLILASGFSGYGLQHAPAVGRALAEFIRFAEYRTIDATPLSYTRYLRNEPLPEHSVI